MSEQQKLPLPEPTVEEAPKPTPELNPRNRAEQEIAAAAAARRAAEAAERIEGMEPAPAQEPAEEPAPEVEAEAAPAETPSEEPAPAADDPEIELIVDGKTVKVKTSQVIEEGRKTLQKQTAADQRLQMASQILEEAKRRAQGAPSTQDAQPQAPVASKEELTEEQLAELIQYGSKEDAARAIRTLRARSGPEDLEQTLARVLPQAVSSHLAFHSAVTEAQREYSDVFANPDLATLFHVEEHRARANGDARPHAELYKAIGDGIRTRFGLKKPLPAGAQTIEQKKEAKASMAPTPKLATARIQEKGETKPLTREEIIAAEQARRGQGKLNPYK